MKKLTLWALAALLAVGGGTWAWAQFAPGTIAREPGGARMIVQSGASLDVESGGEIDIESGGSLKLAGTAVDATAAELNVLDVSAGGNLKIGDGTPGVTQDGEDAYIEGTLEVDGAIQLDGALTIAGGAIRTGVQKVFNMECKLGATSGWALGGGGVDTGAMATMAASQTAGTLVCPLGSLQVGDTITSFTIHAQIESAGNTATLDADLRNIDNTAADPVDASIGAITQVSVTADTAVAQQKASLTHVVLATDAYYVLLTGTTAASTDIQLINIAVTVTES